MPRKSESERRASKFENAAREIRVSSTLKVQRIPTFMDTGECVAVCAKGIASDTIMMLAALYPEAARALGEALIKLADECKPNVKVPATRPEHFMVDPPKVKATPGAKQLVLPCT